VKNVERSHRDSSITPLDAGEFDLKTFEAWQRAMTTKWCAKPRAGSHCHAAIRSQEIGKEKGEGRRENL
jgi:hypothetical protein